MVQVAAFTRGTDLLYKKVAVYISKLDKYDVIYPDDIKFANKRKIKDILDRMTTEGKLTKIKTYPVFYKRVDGE